MKDTTQPSSAAHSAPASADSAPTREEFLAWPLTDIRAVAPAAVTYAPGGTRRSAMFHGIKPWTHEYIDWAQAHTVTCVERFFSHGVKHVFLPLFMSGHILEVNDLELELARPARFFVTSDSMLDEYSKRGWRVRLIGGDFSENLRAAHDVLVSEPSQTAEHTLWWTVSRGIEQQWLDMLSLIRQVNPQSLKDVIRALYGEVVPAVTLLVGFGKPAATPELFPPFLQGDVQCYWSQQAGYSLTDVQLRKIFYDYAYTRQTWRQDKTTRAASASQEQVLWESEFLLGLGRRVGAFWYPDMQGYPTEHLP